MEIPQLLEISKNYLTRIPSWTKMHLLTKFQRKFFFDEMPLAGLSLLYFLVTYQNNDFSCICIRLKINKHLYRLYELSYVWSLNFHYPKCFVKGFTHTQAICDNQTKYHPFIVKPEAAKMKKI